MSTETLLQFSPPGRLLFGWGMRRFAGTLLARQGLRRGLLLTDARFDGPAGEAAALVRSAGEQGVVVHVRATDVRQPGPADVDRATAALRATLPTLPDHVLALGGGSTLALARALCLTLPTGSRVSSLAGPAGEDPSPPDATGAPRPADVKPALPLVALPTTPGGGAGAMAESLLFDVASGQPVALVDARLRPQALLIDPELAMTCPPQLTAEAGVGALADALEALTAADTDDLVQGEDDPLPVYGGRSALTLGLAREALATVLAHLEPAVRDARDRAARTGLARGSALAGLAAGSTGLHALHALARQVAAHTGMAYGRARAALLPYVLDQLLEVRRAELQALADLLGVRERRESQTLLAVPCRVRDLVRRLGLPDELRGCGLPAASVDPVAMAAASDFRLARGFPIATGETRYRLMLLNAYLGRLAGS